ncbi:hypothetical protein [Lacihabitans sp. CCS-44]|nr:hypothetical protein [Lacihabitans sp. CCS-44]
MRTKQLIITFFLLGTTISFAQSKDETTVLQLSKDKWQWMAH